jgi:hypothetical protein
MLDNANAEGIASKRVMPGAGERPSLTFASRMTSASGGRARRPGPIAHRSATANIRADDAAVRARLRELAAIRRRFGDRRLHIR